MPNRPPHRDSDIATHRPPPMHSSTLVELATLIAVARLEESAYGITIREDIESFRGEPVPLASVYAALARLCRRRWLTMERSASMAMPGGRSKQLYRLTTAGIYELEHQRVQWLRLFQALPREFRKVNVR